MEGPDKAGNRIYKPTRSVFSINSNNTLCLPLHKTSDFLLFTKLIDRVNDIARKYELYEVNN